jgi:YidC/Oxa1 family membrane protein insertase
MMHFIWESLLIKPIFNLLIAIYSLLPVRDLGLAVIGVVIVIRLILFPLSKKATRTQFIMQKLQPEVAEIQKKFKGDREAETRALLALYRDHQVNPFSGVFILFLQLPILIALYQVFSKVASHPQNVEFIWSFLPRPEMLTPTFLGFINLASPNVVLAIFAALMQFLQTKSITPSLRPEEHKEHMLQTALSRQMLYLGPALTFIILAPLPAILALYWATTSLWSLLEYQITLRPFSANYHERKRNNN